VALSQFDGGKRYIESVLKLESLKGRVFYGSRGARPLKHHGVLRVDVIEAGILALSTDENHHELAHEGLPSQGQFALRNALRGRGVKRISVVSGAEGRSPEIRLVDALAGFIRGASFADHAGHDERITDVPEWFLKVAG
jgi:hypothetical protein